MPILNLDSQKINELHLKSIVQKYGLSNLEEYTLDSTIGTRLDLLYKSILEEYFLREVVVSVDEISDGKYRLNFLIDGCSFHMVSKSSFNEEDICEHLYDFVVNQYEILK